MRVSFMTFACPECSFDEVLELARRHDYDGIEFRCDSDHRHGVMVDSPRAQRREWRRRLADAGVQAACLATSLQFISAAAIEEAPARIELAVDIGAGRRSLRPRRRHPILDAIRMVAASIRWRRGGGGGQALASTTACRSGCTRAPRSNG